MWKLNLRFKWLVLRSLHHNDIQKMLTNLKSSQEIISKTRPNDSTRSCVVFVVFLEGGKFLKATNDSYKTPLAQSFAVTASNPKMRYTLIYEHFFLHHNWGSLMCCFIFEVHLRVTRNNYILQVMIF